jgi:PAS domain S-box-containing protein
MIDMKGENGVLRMGTESFPSIFQNTSAGIVIASPAGVLLDANPAFCSFLGYTRDELLKRHVLDITHPGDYEETHARLSEAMAGRTNSFTLKKRYIRKDGTTVWGQVSSNWFFDEKSRPLHSVAIIQDITEQKCMEEALIESEERFRATFNQAAVGLAHAGLDGHWLRVNQKLCDIVGYSEEELKRLAFQDITHPDDLQTSMDWHQRMLAGEIQHYAFEKRYLRPDGSAVWANVTVSLVRESAGSSGYLLAVVEDIAERKRTEERLRQVHDELERHVTERTADLAKTIAALQEEVAERISAEKALRKSEERYVLAALGANDGIWDWDFETGEAYVSPRWKSMLGYGENEMKDVIGEWKRAIHPDDYDDAMLHLHNYLEGGAPEYRMEYRLRHKDGSYRWILTKGACFRNPQGKAYRMAGSHTDITERKLAEQALQKEMLERMQAMEELRIKDQMLMQQSRHAAMGEMIGNIAHQWRQPLNALGLMIQGLMVSYEYGEFSKEQLEASVNNAMRIVFHMSQTIDDFRNFFRPDKEKVVFKAGLVVAKAVSLIEGSFRDQQITVDVHTVDDPMVNGYPNEYSQVLLNILINARDAFLEHTVINPQVLVKLFTENHRTVVTITDNAGGIPAGIMDKIFDPYFTTKGPDKGTGVGLFMSKTIIEKNMNGRLAARNTGDGAEFRIEV